MTRTALVLGGGGITGIAWELGILHGLAQAGIDLTGADIVVGTSAGSVVSTQITTGSLAERYAGQLEPPDHEIGGRLRRSALLRMAPSYLLPGSGVRKLQRVGKVALRSHPPGGGERVDVIASRIGVTQWPDRDLRITAVEAETGRFRVFDRESGVDLVSAVAASCAVPTVWPAVAIDGGHYMDGGMRSMTNLDVARDADRVVVLAPLTRALSRGTSIRRQLETVAAQASAVIAPDAEALAAFGSNLLDPERREPAARQGLRQAAAHVEEVARVWGTA